MTRPRKNDQGWKGFDDEGHQQCLTCWAWQFPVIHSCPGCPQVGRTPPPKPVRIQLRRTKGWRKPEGAVVVSRPSKWGNPWVVGIDPVWVIQNHPHAPQTITSRPSTADDAVNWYRDCIEDDPLLNLGWTLAEMRAALAGRDLACWCPLDAPCHGDVLLELANGALS